MHVERDISRQAELKHLPEIRAFIEAGCQALSLSESMTYDLVLAVDEICTNIVTHGYDTLPPGPITVQFEANPRHIQITISDKGRSFNPQDAPEPDLGLNWKTRRIGGLGLFLVGQVADTITYTTDDQQVNHLTIQKSLSTKDLSSPPDKA